MNDTMLLAADSLAPVEEAQPAAACDQAMTQVETKMKSCPVCRAQVFADMETCFNCMYLFGSNPSLEEKATRHALPEVLPLPAAANPENENEPPLSDEGSGKRSAGPDQLLAELLVELHCFLGQFLLDRDIDVKQL